MNRKDPRLFCTLKIWCFSSGFFWLGCQNQLASPVAKKEDSLEPDQTRALSSLKLEKSSDQASPVGSKTENEENKQDPKETRLQGQRASEVVSGASAPKSISTPAAPSASIGSAQKNAPKSVLTPKVSYTPAVSDAVKVKVDLKTPSPILPSPVMSAEPRSEEVQEIQCEVSLVLYEAELNSNSYFERKLQARIKNTGLKVISKFRKLSLKFSEDRLKKIHVIRNVQPAYDTNTLFQPFDPAAWIEARFFKRELKKGEETRDIEFQIAALTEDPQCFRPEAAFLSLVQVEGETLKELSCTLEHDESKKTDGPLSACKLLPKYK
jgi:hypothetical protein